MAANDPTWTDERVELLKQHFEAGLTCRQIADDIGVSRNAVIGKLSRLNLTRGNTGEVRRAPRKAGAKGRHSATGPKLRYQIRLAHYAEPSLTADAAPIHNGHCCSLLELSDARCRWPISTPGADDFCFCGNPPMAGQPYCVGHARLAYRPGYRHRSARG